MPGGAKSELIFDQARLLDIAQSRLGSLVPLDAVAKDGYTRLCTELETLAGSFSFLGKKLIQSALVESLVKRGWALASTPKATDISRPIFILSPYRSATTFLHRLLAKDPRLRAPQTWQVALAPVGPKGTLTKSQRVSLVTRYIERTQKLSPQLGKLHPTTALDAEECAGFLEPSFASASYLFLAPVENYLNWLNDLKPTQMQKVYDVYDHCLRSFPTTNQRWVLKCPAHLWGVEALMHTYPDAQFIHIKRPTAHSVASYNRLVMANHKIYARDPNEARVLAISKRTFKQGNTLFSKASLTIPRDQMYELQFEDFRSNPLLHLQGIYDWLDMTFENDDRTRAELYITNNQN